MKRNLKDSTLMQWILLPFNIVRTIWELFWLPILIALAFVLIYHLYVLLK